MGDDLPQHGVPWAAAGERRRSRFRTGLAHVPGHEGGVLYVREGVQGPGQEAWMTMAEWHTWVKDTNAAPVEPDTCEDDPAACGAATVKKE